VWPHHPYLHFENGNRQCWVGWSCAQTSLKKKKEIRPVVLTVNVFDNEDTIVVQSSSPAQSSQVSSLVIMQAALPARKCTLAGSCAGPFRRNGREHFQQIPSRDPGRAWDGVCSAGVTRVLRTIKNEQSATYSLLYLKTLITYYCMCSGVNH